MKNSVKEKLTKSSLITSFGAIAKFKLLCLISALATIVYLGFLQSDRYASVAMLVINQNSSVDSNRIAADNFLTGSLAKTNDPHINIVFEYVKSKEMMHEIDKEIDLRGIYSRAGIDYFSRVDKNANVDDLYHYFKKKFKVFLNPNTGIIEIEVQSFRSKDSIKIVNQIIKKSEQIINDISKELAVGQLDFVSRDVDESAEKINKIQQNVQALKKKIKTKNPEHPEESTEIDDLQLKLDKLSIELDSATAAYKSALSAQKIVRAEAVQNLKKLVVITGPSTEEEPSYPKRIYNVLLFLCIFGTLYYIITATYAVILSHKNIQ